MKQLYCCKKSDIKVGKRYRFHSKTMSQIRCKETVFIAEITGMNNRMIFMNIKDIESSKPAYPTSLNWVDFANGNSFEKLKGEE